MPFNRTTHSNLFMVHFDNPKTSCSFHLANTLVYLKLEFYRENGKTLACNTCFIATPIVSQLASRWQVVKSTNFLRLQETGGIVEHNDDLPPGNGKGTLAPPRTDGKLGIFIVFKTNSHLRYNRCCDTTCVNVTVGCGCIFFQFSYKCHIYNLASG